MKQALSKLFAFIGGLLREDNGHPSNMRFNNTYAMVLLNSAITFGFIWTVIHWENLIILYLAAVIAYLGTLTGLKIVQKGKEEGTNETQK